MDFLIEGLVIHDPNVNPNFLLYHHAGRGSITGMQEALDRGADLDSIFPLSGRSALHFAATCKGPAGTDAVRWLLEKRIGSSKRDHRGFTEEETAKVQGNEESSMVLKEYHIQLAYDIHHWGRGGEDQPVHRTAFQRLRIDKDHENRHFCSTSIEYTKPLGAPDDEVTLICGAGESYGTGIMMEWERPIMRDTARRLLDGMPRSGLRVLNIGFGLGMIDTYFQEAHPVEHVIIEAHPRCLDWMRSKGWYDRPGVRILEGRWQKFLGAHKLTTGSDGSSIHNTDETFESIDIGKFDAVYFDTFAEGYHGHFTFIHHVPRLLRGPGSRFSFFDTRHSWSCREVAVRHHNDMGMNTEWFDVDVDKKAMWKTIQKYGEGLDEGNEFFIPICALAPTVPRTHVPGVGWNNQPATTKG